MSSRARACFTLLLCVVVSAACGGEPPAKEIQQARTAIDAAVGAGADRWAAEELSAAQDALKRADDAVAQRDYRLALNHALDSLERAQNAAREAAEKKTAARDQADQAIGAATTALNAAMVRLKAAEGRMPAKSSTTLRTSLHSAEERVQEARTAFNRGDWQAASAATATAMQTLTSVTTELDALAPVPARRRR